MSNTERRIAEIKHMSDHGCSWWRAEDPGQYGGQFVSDGAVPFLLDVLDTTEKHVVELEAKLTRIAALVWYMYTEGCSDGDQCTTFCVNFEKWDALLAECAATEAIHD